MFKELLISKAFLVKYAKQSTLKILYPYLRNRFGQLGSGYITIYITTLIVGSLVVRNKHKIFEKLISH